MSHTLFIADLHLDPSRPDITRTLINLLNGRAREAEALFILGDLFEAWIGDDAPAPPAEPVAAALHQLSSSGVPIYFMVGNRDFLLGESFCRACGMRLLTEPVTVDLYGTPTVILHGDSLCTDDAEYQQFRAMVRNPEWQQAFLAKPLDERLAMARQAREQSREHTGKSSQAIMDVNQQAVDACFKDSGATRMIHGHTHRPAVHQLPGQRQRIVLGDWDQQGSLLAVTPAGTRLEHFALAEGSAP